MSGRLLAALAALLMAVPGGCSFDTSSPASRTDIGGNDPSGDDPGERPMEEPAAAPASCADLLAAGAGESGVYPIDPGGAGDPFPVYCDMEVDGGGWTLALKANGERSTFRYTSPLWTSEELLDAHRPDRDHLEAKLASFNRVAFTEVMIRFDTRAGDSGDFESHWVWMDLEGESLLALFSTGSYRPVRLGRARWLGAIPAATLPASCNLEGVNAGVETNRVRLGIVASDQDDCAQPESKLGVGNSFTCADCGECDDGSGLSGPAAGSNDAGCWTVVSFATVLVR